MTSFSEAVIGETFVFQKVYLDALGVPIAVVSPSIKVFRFDATSGNEIVLVAGAPLLPAVPADPGRYTYRYTVPTTLQDGMVLYGEMKATDPSSSDVIVETVALNLKSRSSTPGLNARFVR